jgi:hypothetical protein
MMNAVILSDAAPEQMLLRFPRLPNEAYPLIGLVYQPIPNIAIGKIFLIAVNVSL